jgi:excisionase family DNA binding protein
MKADHEIDESPIAYRPARVAQLLNVSRGLVYKLIESGDLESFTIGTARLIPRESVMDFVNRLEAADGIAGGQQ